MTEMFRRFSAFLNSLPGRIYIHFLVRGAIRQGWDATEARRIAAREVAAAPESILAHFEYQRSEADILSERLARRYDPGMALSEAANRAIAQKQAARDPQLTSRQLAALKVQEETLNRAIRNA